MQIDIPLSYQPMVGETISVNLTGRVLGITLSPLSPNSIMVTLDTDEEVEETINHGQPNKLDPFMATNAGPGSSLGYAG